MYKALFFLTTFLTLSLVAQAQYQQAIPKLNRKSLAEGVSIKMPSNFHEMTDEEIASKYYTSNRPTMMFTDPNGKVDLGLNLTEMEWDEKDVELLHKFYKANINETYPKVTFLRDEVVKINKKKFAIFEFIGEIPADPNAFIPRGTAVKYHYVGYTVHHNRITILNFTCPGRQKDRWREVAKEMMESVRMGVL
jgi:hypothetical protein